MSGDALNSISTTAVLRCRPTFKERKLIGQMHVTADCGSSEDREEQDCTRRPGKSAHFAVGLLCL